MNEESTSVKNNSDSGHGTLVKGLAFGSLAFVLLSVAFWFVMTKATAGSAGHAPAAPAVKEVLHLDSFVVNLADPPGECFLRIGIDLGLGRVIAGRGEKEAAAIPTAHVRDVILRVLTTYQSNELLAPAGKMRLKQQLLESLQAALPDLVVQEVYFTDFLVQR
jgi:flagellar FliL protein